jgi:nucleoside-diphosphate kinase
MEAALPEPVLVLIKPDALKLSLTGYILSQFSEFHAGLRFAAAKIVNVHRMLAEEHYAEHKGKFFYPSLIEYLMGRLHYPNDPHKRRVIALVYTGPNAVRKAREIAGPTNPHEARDLAPGTIRALGTVVPLRDAAGQVIGERFDNLVHVSANAADTEREIKLWFRPTDIMPYMRAYPTERCEGHYYYHEGQLRADFVPGSNCLLAPGELGWQSDLAVLRAAARGEPADGSLEAVVAKYLINVEREP